MKVSILPWKPYSDIHFCRIFNLRWPSSKVRRPCFGTIKVYPNSLWNTRPT